MGVTTEWQASSQVTGVNEWDPSTVFIGFGAFWIQIITEIWRLALQYNLSNLDKGHCSILLACYFTLITGYVCLMLLQFMDADCYHVNSLLSKYCHLWLQKNKKTNKKNALRF